MKVDVIIPTYKPEDRFLELIKRLEKQTLKPERIIIMNTEEKYFEKLLYGTDFAREHPEVEVHHLSKREFDHGGTRNTGVSHSSGDVFVCMTHDCLPADSRLLEELVGRLRRRRISRSPMPDSCRKKKSQFISDSPSRHAPNRLWSKANSASLIAKIS